MYIHQSAGLSIQYAKAVRRADPAMDGARRLTDRRGILKYFQRLTVARFLLLPPDVVRWRGICYGDVTVCVSVTLMYCA